jgi:hypothetical protein
MGSSKVRPLPMPALYAGQAYGAGNDPRGEFDGVCAISAKAPLVHISPTSPFLGGFCCKARALYTRGSLLPATHAHSLGK